MFYYFLKVVFTSVLIVAISEIGKRSSFLGALIASLPLTSLLAISWLYFDTRSQEKVINLSYSIFWIVIPSLVFFISLPILMKSGLSFLPSLVGSVSIMSVSYIGFIFVLRKLGVSI